MRTFTEDEYLRIDADLLIPGRGEPIKNASLIYALGTPIKYVGPTSDLSEEFTSLTPFKVKVLMPGLWDCHVHYTGMSNYSVETMAQTPPFTAGLRISRDIVATLNAGYTSVREMSGYGVDIMKVIKESWVPGPRIYSAVSMLSQTAGHGDAKTLPVACLWDKIEHGLPFYVCDGVAECIKAVRTQIRQGASFIKIAASGGISSPGDDITVRQFNDDELKAIVDEATKNNLLVAAHCHSGPAIEAALHAGCRTIEHGTYLNADLIKLMLEKDAMLIATRSVLEYSASNRANWTDDQWRQIQDAIHHHAEGYALAIKAGVRCALGTDLGVCSISVPFQHGTNGSEFVCAVKAGMTPLQAVEAGTANGPDTLGAKAPRSGQLKVGYAADFIGLEESPLDDIRVLADPDRVRHVWKAGWMYKRDGLPIGLPKQGED